VGRFDLTKGLVKVNIADPHPWYQWAIEHWKAWGFPSGGAIAAGASGMWWKYLKRKRDSVKNKTVAFLQAQGFSNITTLAEYLRKDEAFTSTLVQELQNDQRVFRNGNNIFPGAKPSDPPRWSTSQ